PPRARVRRHARRAARRAGGRMIAAVLALLAVAANVVALLARRDARRAVAGEQRLEQLARLCPDLTMALIDRDLKIVVIEGTAVLGRNGWAKDDLVGRVFTDIVQTERAAELAEHVREAFAGRSRQAFWDNTRGGGDFRVDVVPYEEDGTITHAAVVLRDISVGRALKRSLEVERTFLSAVLGRL